jgi:dTDP-glucose pyrophosphorylase/CBS domain-containing protein
VINDNKDIGVENWRDALLSPDATLQEAINCLEESSLQIVLAINPDSTLIGTLTDGDIRRGLLRGGGLNSKIDSIIFREPLVVPTQLGRAAVIQLMQVNKIHQLPIVDDKGRVVGLHLLDELLIPKLRCNTMIIMAGGKGIRLRPKTENCPKPLLNVGGKPMLEHIIERAKEEGFNHFVLAVHYLGHMIEDYFGDGSRWQIQIEYLYEEKPLGTAGAISLMNPKPNAPFLVTNGDVLTDIRYSEILEFHHRHNASATMAVRIHEWEHPYGVVRTKGVDIVGFEEKPIARTHINAGVYVLDPKALNYLKLGEHCDMPTLFSRLKEIDARTIVYPMHEPWLDVGRPDDLKQASLAVTNDLTKE